MSTSAPEAGLPLALPRRPAWLAGPARALLLRLFARLQEGLLTIVEGKATWTFGRPAPTGPTGTEDPAGLAARLTVRRPRFWVDLLLGGSIGGTESFIAGAWDADDVTAVFRILVRNRHLFLDLDQGWGSALVRLGYRLFHRERANTPDGSRRNIAAHYDLGNRFYELFLDRTMTYSAALFPHPGCTLEEAQTAKYDRLCRKLGLQPRHHLLEIGTGWGGMAEHAARHYGCRVTTTTISREQHAYASDRLARAGLADRVTVLLEDYRDLTGTYDRLVSIEMIEAVGHEFLPLFFRTCAARLAPDGLFALQAITIRDQEYARHVGEVDFIKRYIFPGSCLTSVTSMCAVMTAHTDLQLFDQADLTRHYARTLRQWRENFRRHQAEVAGLGFDRRFRRLWELYLHYCEAGFAEHYIGDVQMIWGRPAALAIPL